MISGDNEYLLNQGDVIRQKSQLGTILKRKRNSVRATYDFSVQGGAVGTINLVDSDSGQAIVLPANAIVTFAMIDVVTAPTSGGSATISFSTGKAAADLKAATAIASITGLVAGIPVGSAATSIKLSADGTMSIVVAVAALTAGKFHVMVDYFLSA